MACAGPGGGCALDLNPPPSITAELLALGPDHTTALDWLDRHRGTRASLTGSPEEKQTAHWAATDAQVLLLEWLRVRTAADWLDQWLQLDRTVFARPVPPATREEDLLGLPEAVVMVMDDDDGGEHQFRIACPDLGKEQP